MKSFFLALACAFVSLPAASQTYVEPAKLTAADFSTAQNGILLFSVGAKEGCKTLATAVRVYNEPTRDVTRETPLIFVDNGWEKSHFSNSHGSVGAMTLPAGHYYLTKWDPNSKLKDFEHEFRFEIVAGETNYIGSLFMPESCSLFAFTNTFEVQDRFERDVEIAVAKNPLFAQRLPVKRLMRDFDPRKRNVAPEPTPMPAQSDTLDSVSASATWDATMSCGSRADTGRNAGAYKVKFRAELRGNEFSLARETADVAESLSGKVIGGVADFIGTGRRLDESAVVWKFHFRGESTSTAVPVSATGNMIVDGRSMRRCELQLAPRKSARP